ncbi:MAG: hypothetical protein WD396_01100 [Pseudohongiellaceae bacterium]
MKLIAKSRILLSTASLSLALFAGSASAEYRVTAFGYSSEYEALLAKDVASAKSILGDRAVTRLDFIETNNLCVTQILASELESAFASCAAALEKVDSDATITQATARAAKASIYSNLAVARAISGDMMGASSDLEAALSLNSRDRNAVSNYTLIHDLATVAEVAQSL